MHILSHSRGGKGHGVLKALKAGLQCGEQGRSPQQTLWGDRQKLAQVGARGPGLGFLLNARESQKDAKQRSHVPIF